MSNAPKPGQGPGEAPARIEDGTRVRVKVGAQAGRYGVVYDQEYRESKVRIDGAVAGSWYPNDELEVCPSEAQSESYSVGPELCAGCPFNDPAERPSSSPCSHPMDRRRGAPDNIWCAVCGSCWYSDAVGVPGRWHAPDAAQRTEPPVPPVGKSPFSIREESPGVFRVYVYSCGLYPTGTREDADRLLRSLEYERAQTNKAANQELEELRGLLARAIELLEPTVSSSTGEEKP